LATSAVTKVPGLRSPDNKRERNSPWASMRLTILSMAVTTQIEYYLPPVPASIVFVSPLELRDYFRKLVYVNFMVVNKSWNISRTESHWRPLIIFVLFSRKLPTDNVFSHQKWALRDTDILSTRQVTNACIPFHPAGLFVVCQCLVQSRQQRFDIKCRAPCFYFLHKKVYLIIPFYICEHCCRFVWRNFASLTLSFHGYNKEAH